MGWGTDDASRELHDEGVGLDEVVGMAGVVARLSSIVLTPALGAWSGVPGHRLPGSVLLHGPSGGGKRFLATAVARTLDVPFVTVDVCELVTGSATPPARGHGSPRRPEASLADLADRVGEQRCVVWLSGIDRLVDRGTHAQRRLAAVLDGVGDLGLQALLLAGTAAPWTLDPDLLADHRFERFIHVPPPDWHARLLRIDLRAARRRIDLGPLLDHVAVSTAGWSGDEIDRLVDDIALLTVGAGSVVIAPVVAAALSTSTSSTGTWRRNALPVLALHDEQGGFDDLVPQVALTWE